MTDADGTCEYVLDPDDPETWGGEEGDGCYVDEELLNEDGVWTCPHEAHKAVAGDELCLFHLPNGDKSDEQVITAFLDALNEATESDDPTTQRRKQQFIGASFGRFDVSEKTLIGEDEYPISLKHTRFTGEVNWNDVRTIPELYLHGITFEKEANFSSATFKDTVVFVAGTFEQSPSFNNAIFNHGVDFGRATFEEGGNFLSATFEHRATFFSTIFSGTTPQDGFDLQSAYFSSATFKDYADFQSATFRKSADFPNATFEDGADFQRVTFAQEANFGWATFEKETGFMRATFEEMANFSPATFQSELDFSNSVFHSVTFTDATFHGKTTFQIRGDMKSMFKGPVDFSDVTALDTIDFRLLPRVDSWNPFKEQGVLTFTGEADFTDASLSNGCNLAGATFRVPPTFTRAKLEGADCSDAEFDDADFTNANLTDVTFRKSSLKGADLETARLSRTDLTQADLRGAALAETILTDARIDDTTRFLQPPIDDLPVGARLPRLIASLLPEVTWTIPACGYDPDFVPPDDTDNDIEWPEESDQKAKSVYRAIENLADLSSRPQLQSRAFIRRQDIQMKQYRQAKDGPDTSDSLERVLNRAAAVRASVARWTLLYGESPLRIIANSLGIVLVFSLLYPLGEWLRPVGGEPITYSRIAENPELFWDSFYFSTLTFTTLGMGDYQSLGFGQMLVTANTAFGAILIALLVFVFGRRAAR